MKSMTCKQLGGACDTVFRAETFEEMANLSRSHGTEMYKKGDIAHLDAMNKMKDTMSDPDAMREWMDEKRKEFEVLPEEK